MHDEYIEKLRIECELRNLREGTIYQYTARVKMLLKWKELSNPNELNLEDARNYLYHLRTVRGKSSQQCNTCRAAFKFFYRFVLHKHWDDDEVPYMRRDLKQPKVIEVKAVERLIDTATDIRNKAIIALMYSSGLRVGELCRLAPDDIFMSTMQVHVRDSKNRSDHWTILSQRALDLLSEYWRSYSVKRAFLFVNSNAPNVPIKPATVQRMLKIVGDEAGIQDMHPHVLRHSFATHMIEQKVPLEQIQAMMGHRCAESTHKYIHVSNKSLMGISSPLDHPVTPKKGRKKKNGQ